MPTKITAIFDNPTNPEAFEKAWNDGVVEKGRRMPGLQSLEVSKVWPKEDGTPTPAYRMIDLYFTDYDAASAAVQTAEAGELFPALAALGLAGVRFLFSDIELA